MDFKKINVKVDPNLTKEIDKSIKLISTDKDVVAYLKDNNIDTSDEFIRRHLGNLLDLYDDLKVCNLCKNILECPKERVNLVLKLKQQGEQLYREYEYCKEFKKLDLLRKRFVVKDFNEAWLNDSISKIDVSGYRATLIGDYLKLSRKKGASIKDIKWIYLKGQNRTGKSYFLTVLANAYLNIFGGDAAVINSSKRLNELKDLSITNKDQFQTMLDKLSNVSILIIDDFGDEFVTDYLRDSVLIPLLRNRANNSLPTFISSSFGINEIQTLYSTNKAGSLRAQKMCELINELVGKETIVKSAAAY